MAHCQDSIAQYMCSPVCMLKGHLEQARSIGFVNILVSLQVNIAVSYDHLACIVYGIDFGAVSN